MTVGNNPRRNTTVGSNSDTNYEYSWSCNTGSYSDTVAILRIISTYINAKKTSKLHYKMV